MVAGAGAVMAEGERPASLSPSVAHVRVTNARRALALAAARFHPWQPATIAARRIAAIAEGRNRRM